VKKLLSNFKVIEENEKMFRRKALVLKE